MNVISSLNRFLNVIREADDCRRKVSLKRLIWVVPREFSLSSHYCGREVFVFYFKESEVLDFGVSNDWGRWTLVNFLEAPCWID